MESIEHISSEDEGLVSSTKLVIQSMPDGDGKFDAVFHLELPDRESFVIEEVYAIYDAMTSIKYALQGMLEELQDGQT